MYMNTPQNQVQTPRHYHELKSPNPPVPLAFLRAGSGSGSSSTNSTISSSSPPRSASAAFRYLPTPVEPLSLVSPDPRTRLPVQVTLSSSTRRELSSSCSALLVPAAPVWPSARFWRRKSSKGSTKMVTSLMRTSGVGRLVDDSTG